MNVAEMNRRRAINAAKVAREKITDFEVRRGHTSTMYVFDYCDRSVLIENATTLLAAKKFAVAVFEQTETVFPVLTAHHHNRLIELLMQDATGIEKGEQV